MINELIIENDCSATLYIVIVIVIVIADIDKPLILLFILSVLS